MMLRFRLLIGVFCIWHVCLCPPVEGTVRRTSLSRSTPAYSSGEAAILNAVDEVQDEVISVSDRLDELEEKVATKDQVEDVSDLLKAGREAFNVLADQVAKVVPNPTPSPQPESENTTAAPKANIYKDCMDVKRAGFTATGVYPLSLDGGQNSFGVRCDMETDGGGWMVIQRRVDRTGDFYKNWDQYKEGFGDLAGNYWLGNEKLYKITRKRQELRVDLEDWDGNTSYERYLRFAVASEDNRFMLTVHDSVGTAGDSLSYHNGAGFTTYDRDYDTEHQYNCAKKYMGAWWFKDCYWAHLNGQYHSGLYECHAASRWECHYNGIVWKTWKRYNYSLKKTEMKIRPVEED